MYGQVRDFKNWCSQTSTLSRVMEYLPDLIGGTYVLYHNHTNLTSYIYLEVVKRLTITEDTKFLSVYAPSSGPVNLVGDMSEKIMDCTHFNSPWRCGTSNKLNTCLVVSGNHHLQPWKGGMWGGTYMNGMFRTQLRNISPHGIIWHYVSETPRHTYINLDKNHHL